MGVGVVRPEAYSTTRVSAAYGYKQVPRQRVPASRPLAGPYGLLTWGYTPAPYPGWECVETWTPERSPGAQTRA